MEAFASKFTCAEEYLLEDNVVIVASRSVAKFLKGNVAILVLAQVWENFCQG